MSGRLALQHAVGHGHDLAGDGFEHLGDGHHDVAYFPAVAAAKGDEGVGAAAAAGTRVRQAEDVGDGVAGDGVAEVEGAGRGASGEVFARQGADAGAAEERVGVGRGRLARRDVRDEVGVRGAGDVHG